MLSQAVKFEASGASPPKEAMSAKPNQAEAVVIDVGHGFLAWPSLPSQTWSVRS